MRLLLIDTCGTTGSLALAEGDMVIREAYLPERSASALLVSAIREELAAVPWPLASLNAVAVVNGPGSFTGVRVGLAAAKGLCEAAGLALVTLSRLAMLLSMEASSQNAFAVLDAGRGEFYVRSRMHENEAVLSRAGLVEAAAGGAVLLAEEHLFAALSELQPKLVPLHAAGALPLALLALETGSTNISEADANYVRQARTLYNSTASRTPAVQP